MTTSRTLGFSLIEVILVLALVGVITSFGIVVSLNSISKSATTQERDLFVSLLLRGARAQAMANVNQTDHGIYIDNDCHRYILFENSGSFTPPPFDVSCPRDSRQIDFTSKNLAVNHSEEGENATIVYDQLSGNVSEGAGTITITNGTPEADAIIEIIKVGQIDW